MTKKMYEDLLERNKLRISELNTLTVEQVRHIVSLENENAVLKKALSLYVDWADECGIAWDNFPDMKEKWYKVVEEKGLGWIDGLVFMVTEEAKEQLAGEE
jgi:hypothetical protein